MSEILIQPRTARARNSHAVLVAALEGSVKMLETAANHISPVKSAGGIELASKIMRQRDQARAALAQAKWEA